MERHVFRRSGERPLAFTGELFFSDATSPDRSHPNYSGSVAPWSLTGLRTSWTTWRKTALTGLWPPLAKSWG